LNICFIGSCGHWKNAYNYLIERSDVNICAYAPGSVLESQKSPFGPEVEFFSDYKFMLDKLKPDLAIVSPVFGLIGNVIIECAKRKIDVFAEKPIALSTKELYSVEKAVYENKIKLCAMHYLRYEPAFYHACRFVREGKIGELRMLTVQKSYKFGTRPEWYSDPDLYPGTIPWVGIHAIDLVRFFSNKDFISVNAQKIAPLPERAALCQFLSEGGVISSVNIDYYRPNGANSHGDDRIRCVGTEGIIEVIGGKIRIIDSEGDKEIIPESAPDLLELFIENKEPISERDIFHITKATLAANESANTNKTVLIR